MGRSFRKRVTKASPERWTETHPDRELWTPHQRALAESMSQEAYEAVYGRGEPAPAPIAVEPEDFSGISDRDLLQKIKNLDDKNRHLQWSGVLEDRKVPLKYQGRVSMFEKPDGSKLFEGVLLITSPSGTKSYRLRRTGSLVLAAVSVNDQLGKLVGKCHPVGGAPFSIEPQRARQVLESMVAEESRKL